MKQYPSTFTEHSSHGCALRLIDRAEISEGVVLDLGCGRSPLVEPLSERGFVHIGCDVDADALAELTARGSETHHVDLLASSDELESQLQEVLSGRPLAAVLALDVLEHLPDPRAALLAVRRFVLAATDESSATVPLVVSIPNISHADIGAKLLLGRWDIRDTGLLDDTHLRFFSEAELEHLVRAGGWTTIDTEDVTLEVSDQAFPADAPSIRPGAPLRELVRAVRRRSDPHGETYQFVRRLEASEPTSAPHQPATEETRPLVTALVVAAGRPGKEAALLADLAAQQPPVEVVRTVTREALDEALRACESRWVAVLDASTRLSPGWSAAIVGMSDAGAGHVLQVGGLVVGDAELSGLTGLVGSAVLDGEPLAAGAFDPLEAAPGSPVTASAYLVPVEAIRTAGLVPGTALPMGAELPLWIARAALVSGIVTSSAPVVVVGRSAVFPPGVAALVTDALSTEPLLLPTGSAERLSDLRRRVIDAEDARSASDARAAVAEQRADRYGALLLQAEAERNAYLDEIERLRSAQQESESVPPPRRSRSLRRRRAQLG